MGVLEAISLAENLVWGAKKYKKAMKGTYADIVIRGTWRMCEECILIATLMYMLIEPNTIIEFFLSVAYSNETHRMVPITRFTFILSEEFKYTAYLLIILSMKDYLRYFSGVVGGYSIPKKP